MIPLKTGKAAQADAKASYPARKTRKQPDRRSMQKKVQPSGTGLSKPQDDQERSSLFIRPPGKDSTFVPDKSPSRIGTPAEGFSHHRKQLEAQLQEPPRSVYLGQKLHQSSSGHARYAGPPPSLETIRQGAGDGTHLPIVYPGTSTSNRQARSPLYNYSADGTKNPWEDQTPGSKISSWPSPESEILMTGRRGSQALARREDQGSEASRNVESGESSITVSDFGVANQEIGQLRSTLEDMAKRSERYKTERDDMRNALVAQRAALEQITRKLQEAEAGRRNLELQLRERSAMAYQHPNMAAPTFQPFNQQAGQFFPTGMPSGNPYQQINTPSHSQFPINAVANRVPAPPAQLQRESSTGLTSMILSSKPPPTPRPGEPDYQTIFNVLYSAIEDWAKTFANVPNPKRDNSLPMALWCSLKRFADVGTISSLLERVETRWALVARLISTFLVEEILMIYVVMGYCEQSDKRFHNIAMELQKNPGGALKKQLMDEQATLVKNITSTSDWTNHLNGKFNKKSSELYYLVTPLLTTSARDEVVRPGFNKFIRQGFDIAVTMYSAPIEWILKFPAAGEKFSSHIMVNEDRDFPEAATELDRRHLRVKIGITPNIIKRDNSGPSLVVLTMHKAGALLMS
ncbi:MAG: hypothetical protein M1837_004446 [Sclerophora amabilis]|nr:MAG: hypothetical protein M1837_004446 [Sclerophora amabilis]